MRLILHFIICSLLFFFSCKTIKPVKTKVRESEKPNIPEWAPKNFGYKPSRTLKNDLIHTKLEISFDWDKKQLKGKAKLTFQPYFYPQDKLELDAKGFTIKSVQLIQKDGTKKDLFYNYDQKKLLITLNKSYAKGEKYSVYIDYVAKPEELSVTFGKAIQSDKGLFFITPDSTHPDKPYQIWTQGETESSSCWFPTIDTPNEKTTQEIYITVENKYKTISNGDLVYSTKNADGTRTDCWKQSLPHAPYLFMVAVGEFAEVKDKWNGIDVKYYVEPAYEKHARAIFGNTPEMMEFFSKKLNYKYPWAKYSSVVVRDYVSGAMENTSATIFMEALQKTKRELLDKNWDNIIAHELFHHWFGDLVTCESWANLPLNESFATYAEYLWEEYKKGTSHAEYTRQGDMEQYLDESERKKEPLIRYNYNVPDDMFDSHSYAKGGCVLHMLRKYVGDEAFFEALSLYLKNNEFKTAEIHHLRLAFEEVTGEDLNWFFNQWFMSPGHPVLKITSKYEEGAVKVSTEQIQDTVYMPVYKLPLKVSIWHKGKKEIYPIEINRAKQQFEFNLESQPDLVIIDEERILLGEIEHKKTTAEYLKQYELSEHYMSKYEALDKLYKLNDSVRVRNLIISALKDPFWKLRQMSTESLGRYKGPDTTKLLDEIKALALNDPNNQVRSTAINVLSRKKRPQYEEVYLKGMNDSSYALVGASLLAYLKLNPADNKEKLAKFENETNANIVEALSEYYATNYDSTKYDWFVKRIKTSKPEGIYYIIQDFSRYLIKAPVSKQTEGAKLLIPLAESSPFEFIRFSAYQSLGLFDLQFLTPIRKRIKENEKSERLKNIYNSLP